MKKRRQRANMVDVDIGKRIRVRRTEMGLSQTELGDRLGVSFQQIQKYEKGVNRVASSRLPELAKLLEVPVSYFYDDPGGKVGREAESIIFEDPRFSIRLLRAYAALPTDEQRRRIVGLMESMAGSEQEGEHP